MAEDTDRGSTITTATAANLLMLPTPAELERIAKGGWIRPIAPGRWRVVDVVQGFIRYFQSQANTISTRDLANILGVTPTWLIELERQGVIKRLSKGTWQKDETISQYVRYQRAENQHAPKTNGGAVSMEAFGRHIGVSRERIRALVAEGIVELTSDGKVDLDKQRLRYIQHLRERPQRSPAHDAWRAARARETELRIAERARELVETDAAEEVVTDCTAYIVMGLESLAPRIGGRDLALRQRIADEVFRLRNEWAARLAAHARSLRATGQPAKLSFGPRPAVNGGASPGP
jgi:hypothetical protein